MSKASAIAKFCEDVSSASIDVVEPYALRSDQDCRAAVGAGGDGEVSDHRQAVGRVLDRACRHRRRHEPDRSDPRLGLASLFVVSATVRSSVAGADAGRSRPCAAGGGALIPSIDCFSNESSDTSIFVKLEKLWPSGGSCRR